MLHTQFRICEMTLAKGIYHNQRPSMHTYHASIQHSHLWMYIGITHTITQHPDNMSVWPFIHHSCHILSYMSMHWLSIHPCIQSCNIITHMHYHTYLYSCTADAFIYHEQSHVPTYTITHSYKWPMDLMDRKSTQTDRIRYRWTVSNRSDRLEYSVPH